MPGDLRSPAGISRRAALVGSALLSSLASAAGAATQQKPQAAFDPNYARVPLRADTVRAMVVQTPDIAIDPADAEAGRRRNLQLMLDLLARSRNSFAAQPDLYCFHEMPLHGFGEWTRAEALKVAIEAPGPETEALGRAAKAMNAYISLGAYVRDRDWPEHVIMMGLLIGPDGTLVARHWKARGSLTGLGLFTSTVYECLDRYVDLYGWDEVIPVARTDIGNISLSGVQNDPMLFLAMAMKGVELAVRYATGAMPVEDAVTMSRAMNAFTTYANSAVQANHRYYLNGVGRGGSLIVDPGGKIVARAGEGQEGIDAVLAMADLRKRKRPPDIQWALYRPLFETYRPRFEPNWFLRYMPKSWADTRAFFKDKGNW